MVHSVDVDKAKEAVMQLFGSDPRFLVLVLVICGVSAGAVVPPEDYLGKPIGADGVRDMVLLRLSGFRLTLDRCCHTW